jgi:polysaccharide biosynthesis transport protein
VPDSYLVTISLEHPQPHGLADVVNAVAHAYLAKAPKEDLYASDKRIQALGDERATVVDALNTKATRRTDIAQDIGVTTFVESKPNTYDQMLINSKEALAAAYHHRVEAEAQLAAVDPGRGPQGTLALDALARAEVDRDPGLNSLKASLHQRRSELLSRSSGLAEDNVALKLIRQEYRALTKEEEEVSSLLQRDTGLRLLQQRRAEVKRATQVEAELSLQVERQHQQAAHYAVLYNEGITITAEMDWLRKRLEAIDNRIQFLSLEATAPGFVRLVTPAHDPDIPSKGGRAKFGWLLLLAATGVGLAAAVLRDQQDKHVRNERELAAVLGVRPLAVIPSAGEAQGAASADDQYRRIAQTVDRERQRSGLKSLAVTAARTADGTDGVALTLARTLGAMGLRVLAIQMNAMAPDPRYREHQNRPGLLDALRGTAPFEECLEHRPDWNVDYVASGASSERSLFAESRPLAHLLQQLEARYDCILLDAPPLTHSDAELVCSLAGGVFVVVPAGRITQDEVEQAARTVERMAPPVVGFLVSQEPERRRPREAKPVTWWTVPAWKRPEQPA